MTNNISLHFPSFQPNHKGLEQYTFTRAVIRRTLGYPGNEIQMAEIKLVDAKTQTPLSKVLGDEMALLYITSHCSKLCLMKYWTWELWTTEVPLNELRTSESRAPSCMKGRQGKCMQAFVLPLSTGGKHALHSEEVCEEHGSILQGAGGSRALCPLPLHRWLWLGGQDWLCWELTAQLCFSGMVSACKVMAPQGEGTFPAQKLKPSLWQQEMLSSPYLLDLLASMQACCRETACCLMGAWSLKLLPEFCWDRQNSVNSTPDRESLIRTHFGMLLCACSLPGGCSSKLINFCDLNHSLLLVVPACAVLHSCRWCALSGDPISMPL